MITIKEFDGVVFDSKKEMYKAFREQKSRLYALKKATFKKADGFSYSTPTQEIYKNSVIDTRDVNVLKVNPIINTTGILDSHNDVHIKGLWKKTIKENKNILHLQEHKMMFDKIIADGEDLKVYTKDYTWKELNFNKTGTTEALEFESKVRKTRNEYMFNQYAKGYVKNHSVGMRYIKLFLCLNSDSKYDIEERDNWEKYLSEITFNPEEAKELGYFWAVTEAKMIEGSSVPLGSNIATPTINIEAVNDTSTKADANHFNLIKAIEKVNFNI